MEGILHKRVMLYEMNFSFHRSWIGQSPDYYFQKLKRIQTVNAEPEHFFQSSFSRDTIFFLLSPKKWQVIFPSLQKEYNIFKYGGNSRICYSEKFIKLSNGM